MSLILYIGLDVHNDYMAVSITPADTTESPPLRCPLQRFVHALQRAHPGTAFPSAGSCAASP